jgi:hypothetical protein
MDCTANPGGQLEINVQKTKKLGKHFVLGQTYRGPNHGLALEDTEAVLQAGRRGIADDGNY